MDPNIGGMKILLVDPDPRTSQRLLRTLKEEFVMDTALNAKDAERLLYTNQYDLLITDTNLPDIDENAFLSVIRSNLKELPIMVISNKSSVSDKGVAFDNGADDYLVKPFSPLELKARVKALVRRHVKAYENAEKVLRIRSLVVDVAKRMVFYKETRISMRKKEMLLLEFLLRHKGHVVTRSEILENVWDASYSPFTNTVEVHLKRLRDKIEKPYNEKYIETVHGFGYLIE